MLSKSEIIKLLSDAENQQELFDKADKIRRENVGDAVHLRGLMEFSNICRNNCMYCGIRASNPHITRYRMTAEDMISTAARAAEIGYKTIVLQSGEDMHFTADYFCPIIEKIKKLDVAVTLSVGERSYEEYKRFRDAGADRYLIRIETTDKALYQKLDPHMSWQQRFECLLMLRDLGYEVGSGIMTGLPEQSIESIADDLLFLKALDIDMAGIGPFIPHKETPLANAKCGSLDLALRTMAVMRLLLPDINIPATTAMETLAPNGRMKALNSGANVVMLNVMTNNFNKFYELYPNKDRALISRNELAQKLNENGRSIGQGYGNHQKNYLQK